MALTSPDHGARDGRAADRSSLYLGAALYCDGAPTPARIRNMSAGGALIEAAVTPAAGAMVQVVRGTLIVHGLVIWSENSRCGIKFSGRVDVQQWRAAPANAEQERVDEVVRVVKAGAVPLPVADRDKPQGREPAASDDFTMAADLRCVADLLDHLGDILASDPDVAERHGAALQNLDISSQMIAAVHSMLECEFDRESGERKLTGLRRSANQALNQPRGS